MPRPGGWLSSVQKVNNEIQSALNITVDYLNEIMDVVFVSTVLLYNRLFG